jgi:hypothetical protein
VPLQFGSRFASPRVSQLPHLSQKKERHAEQEKGDGNTTSALSPVELLSGPCLGHTKSLSLFAAPGPRFTRAASTLPPGYQTENPI